MKPEIVQKITTQTVIVDGVGNTIIEYTEEKSPRSIIIPIAFSLLAFGICGLVVRYFVVRQKAEEMDIQKKISRTKEPSSNEMTEKKIIADAGETMNTVAGCKTNQDMMEYEAQYDPNNDFAIFGIGDHTKGGL